MSNEKIYRSLVFIFIFLSSCVMTEAHMLNPALSGFEILIGDWKTSGTHPLVPGITVHGQSTFSWIEGGAFLKWNAMVDHKDFPNGMAIFGSDDAAGEYFMMHFDERKVSRKYEVSFEDGVLKWWRNAPGFSQRYTWTITENGNSIIGKGEVSKDDKTWEGDLDLTFQRL